MAYKFQFGTTKLSGSTTFEESLVGESTISGSGRISGKELILDKMMNYHIIKCYLNFWALEELQLVKKKLEIS